MNPAIAKSQIPIISMTTFLDFVHAGGNSRLTEIRKAKVQYSTEYNPASDFYKKLREQIAQMHKDSEPPSSLDRFLRSVALTDRRKEDRYAACVSSYKRWLGKKDIRWCGILSDVWSSGDLRVRVNPELGLMIKGQKYAIKLYFKPRAASKTRIDALLHMMQVTLPLEKEQFTAAILDVSQGKLFQETTTKPGLDILLAGEAAAFTKMWHSL